MKANHSAPPWLQDEPELRALLGEVLNRLDKHVGTRQQRIYLPAEKYLPTLKQQDQEADLLWSLVKQLTDLNLCAIKEGKRNVHYDPEWKGARLAFTPQAEAPLRDWLQRPQEKPALQSWREAIAQQIFPGDTKPLLKRRIAIPNMSDQEVATAFAQIGTTKESLTPRQLSARYFRGDSKRLDGREELLLKLFPELPLKPRPILINIYLPRACNGVLFIENQDSYALACEGRPRDTQGLALVYVAGFRGTAGRLRQREGVCLHYSGPGQAEWQESFEAWWFDQAPPFGPLAFWGDLDFSGMGILSSLRQRFGEVNAWEPGYRPLLKCLRNGGGHTLEAADKQSQNDPGKVGCEFADQELLPAVRAFGGVDQELLG
ncbi:MAG: DUF2220 family protein [Candidatus Thiodiazotropha sp.]